MTFFVLMILCTSLSDIDYIMHQNKNLCFFLTLKVIAAFISLLDSTLSGKMLQYFLICLI